MNMPPAFYGTETRIHPLWVLFKPAEDLHGCWTAHCLELDVVTSGTSLSHAIGMVVEAAGMTIMDDISHGRDPHDRRAPKEYWGELSRILHLGQRVSIREILSPGASKGWKALALQINLRIEHGSQIEGQEFTTPMVEPAEIAMS